MQHRRTGGRRRRWQPRWRPGRRPVPAGGRRCSLEAELRAAATMFTSPENDGDASVSELDAPSKAPRDGRTEPAATVSPRRRPAVTLRLRCRWAFARASAAVASAARRWGPPTSMFPARPSHSALTPGNPRSRSSRPSDCSAAQGISEARLRLHPEHLGEVAITLRVEQGFVTATLRAETAATADSFSLTARISRPRSTAQGLTLRSLDVVVDPDGRKRQGSQDTPNQPPRPRRRNPDRRGSKSSPDQKGRARTCLSARRQGRRQGGPLAPEAAAQMSLHCGPDRRMGAAPGLLMSRERRSHAPAARRGRMRSHA